MAEEKEAADDGKAASAPKKPLDLNLILVGASSLLTLAALGMAAYTKLLYQRPAIVEHEELAKKHEEIKAPVEPTEKPVVAFEQMTVDIAMTSGKAHYATLNFSVECRDEGVSHVVKHKKALLVDKVIHALARRQITELNTIQGKLLLKTELIREFNAIVGTAAISDLYFSNFILQ